MEQCATLASLRNRSRRSTSDSRCAPNGLREPSPRRRGACGSAGRRGTMGPPPCDSNARQRCGPPGRGTFVGTGHHHGRSSPGAARRQKSVELGPVQGMRQRRVQMPKGRIRDRRCQGGSGNKANAWYLPQPLTSCIRGVPVSKVLRDRPHCSVCFSKAVKTGRDGSPHLRRHRLKLLL